MHRRFAEFMSLVPCCHSSDVLYWWVLCVTPFIVPGPARFVWFPCDVCHHHPFERISRFSLPSLFLGSVLYSQVFSPDNLPIWCSTLSCFPGPAPCPGPMCLLSCPVPQVDSLAYLAHSEGMPWGQV